MRWVEFIYNQYLESIENKDERKHDIDVDLTSKDMTLFEKVKNELKNRKDVLMELDISKGNIYQFGSIYYVMADSSKYPYEVFLCSPFLELATDEDIIVKGKIKEWLIEDVLRYANNELIKSSILVDFIEGKYLNIMREWVYEGKPLPEDLRGLLAGDSNYYGNMFKESERNRSLFMMPFFNERRILEEVEVGIDDSFDIPLAASSFEPYASLDDIEIVKMEGYVTIKFNEEYKGNLARVSFKDRVVFEGFLPDHINVVTKLYPEQLKELLKVEFL